MGDKDLKTIIHNRRVELNLSLEELAKRVGVTRATIYRWESGDITTIKSDKLVALAAALEVTPEHLVGWPENSGVEYSEEFIRALAELTTEEQSYVMRFMEDLKKLRVSGNPGS